MSHAVRVSELKAELELRAISMEGLFEKEELARTLSDARRAGKADPSLLDRFNQQSAEKAWEASQGIVDVDTGPDMAEATAGDGSLPGGMNPDMMRSLSACTTVRTACLNISNIFRDPQDLSTCCARAGQNPEMMAVLRNPKMQEVMKKVMEGGPEGAAAFMDDPEVREMLSKVKGMTGK